MKETEDHSDDDVVKITSFVRSMISSSQESNRMPKVVSIQPNPEFSSIQEELAYFKALPEEEKDEATRLQTLGPRKMARFVIDVATSLLDGTTTKQSNKQDSDDISSIPRPTFSLEAVPPRLIDPNKTRYCCRMCRCILFGEDDLEDPPHVPSRHQFSHRKHNYQQQSQEMCQSYFLQERLDFMMVPSRSLAGDEAEETAIGHAAEGKFGCPKCHTKMGSWHLYGAQCSCGTWVVPAIQIPQSKVDRIAPSSPEKSRVYQ
jgi:dual specificity phosphatase 12